MIGSRFPGIAVRKSEIAASGPLVPAFEGQYPITDCYVNLKLVFGQSWTLAPAGARGLYVNLLYEGSKVISFSGGPRSSGE